MVLPTNTPKARPVAKAMVSMMVSDANDTLHGAPAAAKKRSLRGFGFVHRRHDMTGELVSGVDDLEDEDREGFHVEESEGFL